MQDHPRLYADPAGTVLEAARLVPMREDQAHYLGAVMRRGPGETVRLFNARDGEWLARIESLHKRGRGDFRIEAQVRPAVAERGPWLLFAPVKRDATDLIVRMATELGAGAIWPVLTERTNAARVNVDRLQAIAIEAAEQCERLSVPDIAEPRRLASVLSEWPADRRLCAAIERRPDPAHAPHPSLGEALLVGPEGGFTPQELDVMRARPFVTAISLGCRILRAETAVAAGLALLQAAHEQWGERAGGPKSGEAGAG